MELKFTILGYLIYAAMALYLAAGILLAARRRRPGEALFAVGFAAAVTGFVIRWIEVDHVPLQNMFEVFLCLGMLMWPISLFCRRFLEVGGEAVDAFLGLVILFPAGLVFSASPQHLPPALQSFLFIPHVAAYMLSYVIMAKAAVPAVQRFFAEAPAAPSARQAGRLNEPTTSQSALRTPHSALPYDVAAHRLVMLGFPLLTLGLVLGSWWGKIAWGDYWNWDPKELWSLISWLIFLGYFHFRYMFGRRFPRVRSALIVAGLAAIILTLLWVNLARIFSSGMHSYASS
jgi:cytochrome c-type biogenesis protein CcsB